MLSLSSTVFKKIRHSTTLITFHRFRCSLFVFKPPDVAPFRSSFVSVRGSFYHLSAVQRQEGVGELFFVETPAGVREAEQGQVERPAGFLYFTPANSWSVSSLPFCATFPLPLQSNPRQNFSLFWAGSNAPLFLGLPSSLPLSLSPPPTRK